MPRILIIDDDADVVRYLSRRLVLANYVVDSAGDGVIGEELARRTPPDVILLDMRMPRRDGLATLAALRRTPETSRIPVIMLSGVGTEENAALAAGANDVLLKPCRNQELMNSIRRLLGAPVEAARSGAGEHHEIAAALPH